MQNYKWYGGRGITVCEQWMKFENFLKDMGDPPDGMTLDRIDPNGNYEPGNCRWATALTQANNRRDTVRFEWSGEVLTITELAQRLNISRGALKQSIYRNNPAKQKK